MADDWRVTVTLASGHDAATAVRGLHDHEVDATRRAAHGDRIAVSSDGATVFLYADTRGAAEAGERSLQDVLKAHGLQGEPHLDRWHHLEERWEDASVPLPETAGAREVEHERLEAEETEESVESGVAEWEVRVEVSSRKDAEALAAQLEQEGWRPVRRSSYLLVGANDRDDAEKLARRLERDAPHGAKVHVEPGAGLAWELRPYNPFSIFGGLGL
ncbi:MAG TPA: hypothetical protein VFA97_01230 [Gaiellaceae bacterium]|nr:hypothetical protein [Gaiellaceae bacterium]